MNCLCAGRDNIVCSPSHCDLAGPGEPGNPNQCRVCWLRIQRKRIQDEGWAVINLDAGGIGDALLGLTAVAAFRQQHPNTPIDYRVHAHALPFMELFDAGFDVLSVPGSGVTTHRINCRFDEEYSSKCAVPRWLRYCNCIGVDAPLLPVLRDREALLAKGSDFRGVVAVIPSASWQTRIYPHFVEVEKLLLAKGIRTVVFSPAKNRFWFHKERVIRRDAETIAAVMLNARCVIGGDTGLTHLAGIMGCPTVVLNGPTKGEDIHGFYPRVRSLSSSTLPCTGCYWQSPYSEACEPRCPALASIRPEDVVAVALDGSAFPAWTPPAGSAGPSLARRAVNFAKALVSHVAAGAPTVSDEEAKRRLSLCEVCSQYFDPVKRRCRHSKCGCNLDSKARWADQHCPIGKW